MAFWRTYYHLVWATKNRDGLISAEIEPILFSYLQAKARENSVEIHALNGWFDHIHLVVSIPPSLSVAECVKRLKGSSSHYLNNVYKSEEWFGWHRGYGVFTLGKSQLPTAISYVENQKQHHDQNSTNEWLEKSDIETENLTLGESIVEYETNLPF